MNHLERLEELFLIQAKNLPLPALESPEIRRTLARTAFAVFAPEIGHGGVKAMHRIDAALEAMGHDDACPLTALIFVTVFPDKVMWYEANEGVPDSELGQREATLDEKRAAGFECNCGVDALTTILMPEPMDLPETTKEK